MAANANIKENIKASALELFNSPGYEATSIRDLSAKAKCSLPMMYYYYESKEKLLHEIEHCYCEAIHHLCENTTPFAEGNIVYRR